MNASSVTSRGADRGSGVVSLSAIAEQAGVSVASVSRILRNKDRFSDETRKNVLAVARRLGYRPNLLVRGIQTGRTRTVGVMIRVGDEFFGRMAVGIHDTLIAADHVPIFVWPRDPSLPGRETNELEQIHRLVDRRVDAVILRPVLGPGGENVGDHYLHEVWNRGTPLVTVDRELPHTRADFAGTDDEAGGRNAGEHLIALGHRLCGHVAGPELVHTSRLRRRGFEGACRGADVECVTAVDETFQNGHDAAIELLSRRRRPTCIFTGNDYQVPGVYDAAAELGLRIPQDLSVVGFADLQIARVVRPRLTTLRQEPERIGAEAARVVLDRLDGRRSADEPRRVRLEPKLIARDSTAPPVQP